MSSWRRWFLGLPWTGGEKPRKGNDAKGEAMGSGVVRRGKQRKQERHMGSGALRFKFFRFFYT
jgi:hypothetical protein